MAGMRRSAFGWAIGALVMVAGSGVAQAQDEIVLRHEVPFVLCPQTIDGMLASLGADHTNTQLVVDTGAHYGVKLKAVHANLVFFCNAVTGQMTVTRTTPGELMAAK